MNHWNNQCFLNKSQQKVKEKPTALAFLKRLQSVQIYPRLSGAKIYII